MTSIRKLLPIVVILLTACEPSIEKEAARPRNYYLSSSEGNDANDGLSPQTAWQSLDKINTTILKPGQKVFFKSGNTWSGQLEPKGSGAKDSLLMIDRYGEGPKPRIDGWGQARHTLLLDNNEYITVRNLEITNQGAGRKAKRVGVLVQALNVGDRRNITLDGLEIHHVNGSLVKSEGGGSAIFWNNGGDSIPSRFVDLTIENCHLHHCGRNGITASGYAKRNQWHPSLGVIIRNNLLEQIPGDGIVPIGTDGALIEHNIMRDSPDVLPFTDAAAGIWPWSADNTVIQFNEVSGHKAKWDGQGFDSDYNCNNTTIQYNYSHDNYGGFLLVCNDGNSLGGHWNQGTKNTVVRYNISINDGIRPYATDRKGWFSPLMHISGPVENTKIHHNMLLMEQKQNSSMDKTFIYMDNWGGPWPIKSTIHNNVFMVSNDEARFHFEADVETRFSDNQLVGKIPKNSYRNHATQNRAIPKPKYSIDDIRQYLLENRLSKPVLETVWANYMDDQE